jgi:DNA-binding NarL/FixJ family response regulator
MLSNVPISLPGSPDTMPPILWIGPTAPQENLRLAHTDSALPPDAPASQIRAAAAALAAGLHIRPAVALAHEADESEFAFTETLTERELEVLNLLADGFSNPEIGRQLRISRNTVKFHVSSIMGKLGAGTRTEAVTLGLKRGLIII